MNAAEWWGALDQCGFTVMRALLSVLWQSSIVFAGMGLLAWVLRRRRTTVRHALWLAALLTAPVLPLLTSLAARGGAPQAPVSVLPAYVVAEEYAEVPPVAPMAPLPAAPTVVEPEPVQGEQPQASVLDYPWALLFLTYLAGLTFLLGWMVVGRLRLRQWVLRATPVLNGRVLTIFREAGKQLGLRRELLILESDQVPAPLTAGFLRPVVLLPAGLPGGLSDAELRAVALHESAHIRRRDPLVLSLIPVVRAVLFFHPLVWLACRQVSRLSEQAADDAVLDATGEPVAYARILARLAADLRRRSLTTELAAGIVLSKGAFLRRVEAILSDRRDQIRRLSRWALAMTVLGALLSLILAAALPLGEKPATSAEEVDSEEQLRQAPELVLEEGVDVGPTALGSVHEGDVVQLNVAGAENVSEAGRRSEERARSESTKGTEPWTIEVPGGGSIQVVAISRPLRHPLRWWSPDGLPILAHPRWSEEAHGFELAVIVRAVHPGAHKYGCGISGWAEGTAGLPVTRLVTDLPDPAGERGGQNVMLLGIETAEWERAAEKSRDLGLTVGYGIGAWQTVGVLRRGEPLEAAEGTYTVEEVKPTLLKRPGSLTPWFITVRMRYPLQPDFEVALAAVDGKGSETTPEQPMLLFNKPPEGNQNTYYRMLYVDVSDVDHFLLKTRPRRWATFTNLALTPAVTTRAQPGGSPLKPVSQGTGLPSSTQPTLLSKEELLAAVEAMRSRIGDLSVSFSFDAVEAPDDPNFWGARTHRTVVVKGDKTYVDHEYGPAAEYRKDLFRREVAFNGERSTIHEAQRGVASVTLGRQGETETQGCGFFDLMLLNPPQVNGYGRDDQSLVSLLRSDLSLLRESREVVDGNPCYVLDVTHPSLGKTCMTVWLDAHRGFLPVKQVYYFGQDLDQIIMEFVVEEAVELDDGLWFPVRGYKRVGPVPAASADPDWRMVHEMKVDGVDEGKRDIAVNTGVEDEFFDLWKHLPAGTRLTTPDAGAGGTGRPEALTETDAGFERQSALRHLLQHNSVEALLRLLKLNGDQTAGIERIGSENSFSNQYQGSREVLTIKSAGHTYILVLARRYGDARMRRYAPFGSTLALLFDERGHLVRKLGGETTEEVGFAQHVQFTTLGTGDRWFAWVATWVYDHEPFRLRVDVHLIESGCPLAFRLYGFPNVLAWTEEAQPVPPNPYASFFLPGDVPWGAKGVGRDEEEHEMIIGWDPETEVFRGPSAIQYDGKPLYQVDLSASRAFEPTDVVPRPAVRARAPELELEEGAGVSLAQFKGRPVVVAFVSIYSRPCVKVLDDLRDLQAQKGVDALGVIAIHDRTATPEEIEEFRKDHGIPFPIVRVPDAPRDGWASATFRAYGITALPTVVFVDAGGKVVSTGHESSLPRSVSAVFHGPLTVAETATIGEVTGEVLRPDGSPAPGAQVTAVVTGIPRTPGGGSEVLWKAEVAADENGTFVIPEAQIPQERMLPYEGVNTAVLVRAHGSAFSGAYFARWRQAVSEPYNTLEIRLNQQTKVTGTVSDADGDLLAGATVSLIQWRDETDRTLVWLHPEVTPFRLKTGEDGSFTFGRVPASGELTFHVEAKGLPAVVVRTSDREVRVALPRPGSLVGRVVTADGSPIAGCRVWIEHQGAYDAPMGPVGWLPTAALSDQDGRVRFEGLFPGVYAARVEPPEHPGTAGTTGLASVLAAAVTVTSGEVADLGAVTLKPGGLLGGRAQDGDTGEPLSDVRVRAYVHPFRFRGRLNDWTTTTDANGRYQLCLSAGSYRVQALKDGYMVVEEQGEPVDIQGVRIEEGSRIDGHDFVLYPVLAVKGRLLLPDGSPAALCYLDAEATSNRRGVRSRQDGTFTVKFRPGDEVHLTARLPEHGARLDATFTVRLEMPPQTFTMEDVGNCVVTGRVIDDTGEPVKGQRLYVMQLVGDRGWNVGSGTTDEEGRFTIRALAGGDGHISFEHYWDSITEGDMKLELKVGSVDMGDLVLPRLESEVAGVVVDIDGQPVAGAAISARGVTKDGYASAESGKDGRFHVTKLPNDAIEVRAYFVDPETRILKHQVRETVPAGATDVRLVMGITQRTQEATVSAGDRAPELVLEEGAGVTLDQFRGKPVVLAFVSIYSRPCVKVLDDLKDLQAEAGADTLGVVAVHDRTATPEEIDQFRKDHGIPFPIVRVPDAPGDGWASDTFRAYGITAVPTVVVLDRQGKLVSMGDGSSISHDILGSLGE